MYNRLCKLSKNNSFFLFGARATGKTSLILEFAKNFGKDQTFRLDLLDPEVERDFSLHPSKLMEVLSSLNKNLKFVFIDEVQKVPKLLDVVHKMIFEKKIKFALTGSSARKLKRGKANLLAGRAFSFKLHPLTAFELGEDFNLLEALRWGTLPEIFKFNDDLDKKRYLNSYVQNYIKEEILVEQLIRNIEPFRAFLEVASQSNTEIINYSKLAREAGIEPKSVERYFDILHDTLLGFFIEPYSKSIRKRQSQKPKFYFFDLGVVNVLSNQIENVPVPKTYGFGKKFEHFIIMECIRLNDYYEKNYKFSYLRTKDGLEIDLIVEQGKKTILIEIKSTEMVQEDHLRPLNSISKDINAEKYVFCLEKRNRKVGDIQILNWKDGLKKLFF